MQRGNGLMFTSVNRIYHALGEVSRAIAFYMEAILTQFNARPDAAEPIADCGIEGARDNDRRQHSRNVKVMRVARLKDLKLHAECLGMVRDVSPGGMMIDAHFPLEIGQTLSVALLDSHEFSGEVVWQDGNTYGIRFPEEVDVHEILAKPSIQHDGRRARLPRFLIDRSATLHIDTKAMESQLLDISQRGAKLVCGAKMKMHMNILIRIDPLRSVRATVKWQAGNVVGVEFHRLFTLNELRSWLNAG
jgi:PilZ domain